MSFQAIDAAISARSTYFSTFRLRLLSGVGAALILAASGSGAYAQLASQYNMPVGGYYMPDPSDPLKLTRTNDFNQALNAWRADAEFKGSYNMNWGLRAMGAEYMYALGHFGTGLKFGVADTGSQADHPEFLRPDGSKAVIGLVVEGVRAIDDIDTGENRVRGKAGDRFRTDGGRAYFTDSYQNPSSHGTHVMGIINGTRNNVSIDYVGLSMGIAYGATGYALNIEGDGPGEGPADTIEPNLFSAGIQQLVNQGVSVINNSWGMNPYGSGNGIYTKNDTIRQYQTRDMGNINNIHIGNINYNTVVAATRKGVAFTFAAGNDYRSEAPDINALPYFLNDQTVEQHYLTVLNFQMASTGELYGSLNPSSNICGYAKYWCVGAPGSDIPSAVVSGGTDDARHVLNPDMESDLFSGTSMAAPATAAGLLLVMDRFPYLTTAQAVSVLETTSDRSRGGNRVDDVYGWGPIDLAKAARGPAEFHGRFDVNLSNGKDLWSNDISQAALDQRRMEEMDEVNAWPTRKAFLEGLLTGGSPAEIKQRVNDYYTKLYTDSFSTAKALVQTLVQASRGGKYEEAIAALRAVRANETALELFKFYGRKEPSGNWHTFRGLGRLNALLSQPDAVTIEGILADRILTDKDVMLPGVVASWPQTHQLNMMGTLQAELDFMPTRIDYLKSKLADPSSYLGGLTKWGSGQLTLTGDSTYSGDTVVNGGELVIGKEGSITSSAFVNTGALFTVEGIAASTAVNKGGHLNVTDTGKTGNIVVNGGWAAINGKGGETSVSEMGVVSGIGTVEGLTAKIGGIVSPGNSVGTLNVIKDARFEKGSIFDVEIKADQSAADRLAVAGTATLLGGVVNVRLEGKTALLNNAEIESLFHKHYDILTANKVEGKFDALNTASTFNYIASALDYSDASKVALGFERKDVPWTVGINTYNQKAVSGAIQSLEQGNALYNTVLLSTIDNPLNFDALSGEVHATLSGVLAQDNHFISDAATARLRNAFGGVAGKAQAVTAPLAYGSEGKKAKQAEAFAAIEPAAATTALWGEAYGSWAHADGNGNAAAYNRNTGGFVTGLDGIIAEDWRLGLLAGYGNTSLHGNGKASVDSYQLGVYGGTKLDALGLRFGVNLAQHEIETKRSVEFGSLSHEHQASYDAQSVQVFGELGYEINTPYAALEPFAAARYVHVKTDGFEEDRAISNLTGAASSTDLTVTTLGLRASRQFALSDSTTLTARGMLGWNHGFGDVTPEASLAFNGGKAFAIKGASMAKDAAVVEAGLDFGIGKATSIGVSYTGQFSSQSHDNAIKADLSVRF